MLDRHATAYLVRLRNLLEHARRLAPDTTEAGRHVALIALDGACEYAMWLAGQQRGLSLGDRANFHEALIKLAGDQKLRWQQSGRAGVVQMHSARNQAQHAGALPDPSLMDGWCEASVEFVTSLVKAAFNVELDDVLLADAIHDPRLRDG